MASAFFGGGGGEPACSPAPVTAASTYCTPGRSPLPQQQLQQQQYQQQAPRPPAVPGSSSSRLPSPTQALPWRPPATRRFLWDRTPLGPAVVSDLGSTKVRLSVAGSAWKLLQRLHQGKGGTATLMGRLTAASAGGLEVEVGTGPVSAADITVPVVLQRDGGLAAPQLQAAQLSEAYELGCSRQQVAGAAQLLQVAATSSSAAAGGVELHGLAAFPAALVTFKPIMVKSVSPRPLSQALQDTLRGAGGGPVQDGYLSMDQGRSLVPLAATDPVAHAVPLVGVWAAGVDGVRHPLVAAACIKYLCSKALVDKALELDRSFLLLLYCPGRATMPLCFECHVGLDAAAVPLKAMTFVAAARPPAWEAATCELAPAQGVSLPGCPVAIGRGQGSGARAAQTASERRGWQSARRPSPGSAGSGLSVTSACPNRSALRLGESPNILPPCGPQARSLGAGSGMQQVAWGVSLQEKGALAGVGLVRPDLVAPAAAEPLLDASQTAQLEQGSCREPSSSEPGPNSIPPGRAAAEPQQAVSEPPAMPANGVPGRQRDNPLGESPSEAQQPAAATVRGPPSGSSEIHASSSGACEVGPAVPGTLNSRAEVAQPINAARGSLGAPPELAQQSSEHRLSCDPTQCEDCSGSMPSLAGWSSSFRPPDQASSANSLHCTTGPPGGGGQQEQLQQPPQQPLPQVLPMWAPLPTAVAETTQPATSQDLPGPGHSSAAAKPAAAHSFASPALFTYGGSWVLQPSGPELGLSQEVVVLQQEVLMLRQQVHMLQLQLQECQMRMQAALPVVVPPHYLAYSDSWGLPAMPWLHPQPGPQPFAQGAGAATPASFQQSCSAYTGEATPTSQPRLPGAQPASLGSPAACSPVATTAAAAASPAPAAAGHVHCNGVEVTCSPMQPAPQHLSLGPSLSVESETSLGQERQPPHCTSPQQGLGQPEVAGNPWHAREPPAAAAAAMGDPCASAEPNRLGELRASKPRPISALPTNVVTPAASPAMSLAPGAVTQVEADIDRLIEHAERAVSMLSFYSGDGGVEDRVAEWLGSSADHPDLPCRPSAAASSGSWVAAGSAGAAAAAAPVGPALALGATGQMQRAASSSSWSSAGAGLPGVVRVQLPSFLDLDGLGADADEDAEEVERLELKYGLANVRSRC